MLTYQHFKHYLFIAAGLRFSTHQFLIFLKICFSFSASHLCLSVVVQGGGGEGGDGAERGSDRGGGREEGQGAMAPSACACPCPPYPAGEAATAARACPYVLARAEACA